MRRSSVIVWGCFNYFKKPKLAFSSESLHSLENQNILNNYLLPFINEQNLLKIIFQMETQDHMFQHLQKII